MEWDKTPQYSNEQMREMYKLGMADGIELARKLPRRKNKLANVSAEKIAEVSYLKTLNFGRMKKRMAAKAGK